MTTLRRRCSLAVGLLLGTAVAAPAQEPAPPPIPGTGVLSAPAGMGIPAAPAAPAVAMPPGPAGPGAPVPAGNEVPAASAPCPGQYQDSFWRRFCFALQDCFLGYAEEFKAPPLGHFVYLHNKTQVANGDAARMVLYDYDFVPGSDQLTMRGRYQLQKIVAMLPQNFFPIVIEGIPASPELEAARRISVLYELGSQSFPVPPERVVVGRPIANGLPGEHAMILNGTLLGVVRSGGFVGGPATGPSTGGGATSQGFPSAVP